MSGYPSSDKALVRRLLAGDERAFESFFRSTFPKLYRFALARVGGDSDVAEEVVQSTLCKVIDKLHTFRGEAALFTWICTFCRFEISAYYRRQGRSPKTVSLFEFSPDTRAALESLTAFGDDPEDAFRRKEVGELVRMTLDYLPSRYGDALEWKYIHGLSVKEIAVRLEVGPKAAESLLTRARQAFRDGFASICEELAGGPVDADLAMRRT